MTMHVHNLMGESNTVVSAYTLYRHLQQYSSHPLICVSISLLSDLVYNPASLQLGFSHKLQAYSALAKRSSYISMVYDFLKFITQLWTHEIYF